MLCAWRATAGKKKYEEEAAKRKVEVAAANVPSKALHDAAKAAAKAVSAERAKKNPYTMFVCKTYTGLKAQHPAMSSTEIMKLIAHQWKGLSEATKASYKTG